MRPIYRQTAPVFLGSELENPSNLVDIYMVGRLGVDAMSAVSIATSLTRVIRITMVAAPPAASRWSQWSASFSRCWA